MKKAFASFMLFTSFKYAVIHRLYFAEVWLSCLSARPLPHPRGAPLFTDCTLPKFGCRHCRLVEMMGFEPMTPCLQGRCSPN